MEKNSLKNENFFGYSKGINTDISPELQPENTYRSALNMVKESSEGDLTYLTTEYSNIFKLILPGKILHANLIKQLDIFILFLDNNEIGVYYPNTNEYKKIYKSSSLDFNYYVESVYFTKTECEEIVLIFWDGKNRIKNINITNYLKKLETDSNCCNEDEEDLNLFKTAETCVQLESVVTIDNEGFKTEAGSYMPFIQYEDEDFNQSNFYILNHNIPLIEDNIEDDFRYIDGNETKFLNKALKLTFSNLDTNYKYANIGLIKTVNNIKTSFLFKRRVPVLDTISVEYKGEDGNEVFIDLAEVFTPKAFYLSANHGLLYNNRLLLGGVKGIKNINYQKYANQINVKYVTGKILLDETKGYKNPQHIIHHKSWMRDENYMLGIVWEFEDFTESPVFPLIGRKIIAERDLKHAPQDIDGELSIHKDIDICCTEDIKYWKVANTAKRTAFNAFAGNLNTEDYCSQTLDTSLTNKIRSEGELGYFESTDRYPVIIDCNGDYMFPTEKDLNGKVRGQKIRLFKMPDSTIEPVHNNIEDYNAENKNNNNNSEFYNKLEIYPLGLKLENITPPDDADAKITGYRIVYVKRESFNKSIADKGWFVEMFKNTWADKDYIYPKHNVNAGAKWDYFSNHRDDDLEDSSPVVDFVEKNGFGSHYNKGIMFYGGNTMFKKKGISVDHIKIEQQYKTKGFYIDSIKNQNGYKPASTGNEDIIDPSTFLDKDGRLRRTAIQIYNMYNYDHYSSEAQSSDEISTYGGFHNVKSNFRFKNICVDNYSYVGDNLVLNKIANSEFNLVNLYRESGFYLDFKDESDLAFTKVLKNFPETIKLSQFNSDTSSKKCDCGDDLGGEDFYFNNYIDDVTDYATYKLDECNLGYIYYGSIKNYINNQYGKIEEMEFIDTGLKGCVGDTSLTGFYGDSYINTFSFVRTGVTGMLEDSKVSDGNTIWMDKDDPNYNISEIINDNRLLALNLPNKPNVTLINTITESDYNLDLRHEGLQINELYYPKLQNGKYNLYSNSKSEYPEDAFLHNYFYEIICASEDDNCATFLEDEVEYNDVYRNFHDNYIDINQDYLQYNGIRPFYSINENYKTCDCDNFYDNRVIVSKVDNETISRNNYSRFYKNDFITIPHKEGKLTNLFLESQQLYAHTTDTIWKLQTLESKLQANNNNIYVGTNDLLSNQPLNLYISNEGYGGLQNKLNSYQNNYGYFFIDLKNQSLNQFHNNQIIPISDLGLRNFFKNIWNTYFNSYTQNINNTFRFGFDHRHKRLLITDINNSITLSYYPEDKAFYSLHSYIPNFYFQNRDTFFTQDGTNLYLHEDNINGYRNFYGDTYRSFIQGVFKTNAFKHNILNNVGFLLSAKDDSNKYTNSIPNKLEIWTERQHSNIINLNNTIDTNYMSNIVMNNYANKVDGVLFYNNIYDYVLNPELAFLNTGIIEEINNNVSYNKDWNQLSKLKNNWFIYRLIVDNLEIDTKYIYKGALFNYNFSIR